MGNPLLKPLSGDDDAELARLVKFYDETLGFCPNSIRTMHRRPAVAKAFIALNQAVMENRGRVSSSLKRLIAFLSSRTAGCRYCQAHAIRAAERYGAGEAQLEGVWDYRLSEVFTEAEKAAFDFAIAASSVPNGVDDQISDNLRRYWDEGEIVEILGVVSLFGFLNRWNDSMSTELEGPALESGRSLLGNKGWHAGKHGSQSDLIE